MTQQDLSNWKPCASPGAKTLGGSYCRLEPLDWERHGEPLFHALNSPESEDLWTYIPLGPFKTPDAMAATMNHVRDSMGWRTMVILDVASGAVLGMASYMRIRAEHGSAEVGCVVFSKALQRTRAATEVIYLMARHLFDDLGYRRFEWKCNEANKASKRAAVRFGFTFEGIFRNDMVMKGKNRDTAWYSMLDSEWPDIRAAFDHWLRAENFNSDGKQRSQLSAGVVAS